MDTFKQNHMLVWRKKIRNEPIVPPFAEEINCKEATASEKHWETSGRYATLCKYIFVRNKNVISENLMLWKQRHGAGDVCLTPSELTASRGHRTESSESLVWSVAVCNHHRDLGWRRPLSLRVLPTARTEPHTPHHCLPPPHQPSPVGSSGARETLVVTFEFYIWGDRLGISSNLSKEVSGRKLRRKRSKIYFFNPQFSTGLWDNPFFVLISSLHCHWPICAKRSLNRNSVPRIVVCLLKRYMDNF